MGRFIPTAKRVKESGVTRRGVWGVAVARVVRRAPSRNVTSPTHPMDRSRARPTGPFDGGIEGRRYVNEELKGRSHGVDER